MRTAVTMPPSGMNALEGRFASEILELERMAGEILWWRYEPMRFRIGSGAFYKPDFVVVDGTGQVIAYETKGHWREAARARIKVAADLFPWVRFIAVTSDRGRWALEEFKAYG